MRIRETVMAAALAAVVTGLLVVQGPASAGAAQERESRNPVVLAIATDDVSVQACAVTRFGYTGYRKCDAAPLDCDFTGDGAIDESWVISDSRRIWHAWRNSGGWKEMPNNGRADFMAAPCFTINGYRAVEVYVSGSDSFWYSWRDNSGVWHGWLPS